MQDPTKLAVANRISIWLENQQGFNHYTKLYPNNPGYFLHFTSVDNTEELHDLEEGLDFCRGKIKGENPEKEYGFSLVQKVKGGKAGACYLYPEPNLQNENDIATLEANIIALAQQWAFDHNATMNVPVLEPANDKYMIITIDL